jgi:hypothetical protein
MNGYNNLKLILLKKELFYKNNPKNILNLL